MAIEGHIERILRLYPAECQPRAIQPFGSPTSFSGARLWRITTPRGELCLRGWPAEHPSRERLEFVQAVLWHVDQEGFRRAPLPLETNHHHGFVHHNGHYWELTPWLPGTADYRQRPNATRLANALAALAEFHLAARTFPLPETGPIGSPGMSERVMRLQGLLGGRLAQLRAAALPADWPELAPIRRRLVELAGELGPKLLPALDAASQLDVSLQPCIRDVWHAHVLFSGDEVTGIVDFGAMRPDNVAADVARLLGSLAQDCDEDWQHGLAAYQRVRPLNPNERELIEAFDRSTVLMGGLQWLEWIAIEGRTFASRPAVLDRLHEFLARGTVLAQRIS